MLDSGSNDARSDIVSSDDRIGGLTVSVLLVDDCVLSCRSLDLALGGGNAATYSLTDGRKAAKALQPDFIVLDVSFPYGDGIEAIPRFLEDAPNAKIVMLTADYDKYDRLRAFELGAVAYVEKGDYSAVADVIRDLQVADDGATTSAASSVG